MRRPARCAWLATLAALAAAAVPAGAATRPDLAPSGVRVTGVTVEAGSCAAGGCRVRLTVAADVLNRGSRGARRTRLGFFVSRDARRDGRDATAGQRWVQAIRGGGRRRAENTARQNAINHHLNAMIGSELAWRNAMDDWKAYDMRLITAQQYSDATVFAHRTLEDARTDVANAENAVKAPR
jgi:hypothetical protein